MPELLNVVGRISFRDVWSYLEKVKQTPTKVRCACVGGGGGLSVHLKQVLVGDGGIWRRVHMVAMVITVDS